MPSAEEYAPRMVLAQESRRPPGSRARPHRAPTRPRPLGAAEGGPGADEATRAAALRRIVAEVSGSQDLDRLFQEVIDASFTLFGADRAGLWIYDDSPAPLTLAAQRGLSSAMLELIASLPRDAQTVGMTAIRERHVTVLAGDLEGTVPRLQRMYRAEGIRSMCFVPIVFRDEALGLLVLYHRTDYDWSDDETDLARSFADHIAIAIGTRASPRRRTTLAERLRAISELAVRLNRIQDLDGIAAAIVGEARPAHRPRHHPGLPRRPRAGSASRSPSRARSSGAATPTPRCSGSRSARASPGGSPQNNQTIRLGDAGADPRGAVTGPRGPESMLVVPMTFEDASTGSSSCPSAGATASTPTTRRPSRSSRATQPRRSSTPRTSASSGASRPSCEHQLASQRRLLEVNERLLSTLDPNGVLELIADSLKAIVPYDSLTIYRVRPGRRRPPRGHRPRPVRRAHPRPRGPARRRDHRLGRRPSRGGPRQRGAPRPALGPDPGHPVRARIDDRRPAARRRARRSARSTSAGWARTEAHFTANEFELTKLFAGQASIALQNAEAHGAVQVRAEHDALTGLRNHGAFQRELGERRAGGTAGGPFALLMMDLDAFKAFNDTRGHPAGDALLAGDRARRCATAIRDGDRVYRYGGDEFAAILPGADRIAAHDVAERIRAARGGAARGVRGPPRSRSASAWPAIPDDGRTKDALVAVADRAHVPRQAAAPVADGAGRGDDPYLRALDETALALLDRRDTAVLLETILTRACALLGHAARLHLHRRSRAARASTSATASGMFADCVGYRRMPVTDGVGGQVVPDAAAGRVDDYDTWATARRDVPTAMLRRGGRRAADLRRRGGRRHRPGVGRRADRRSASARSTALTRFAQLASIALDNARLFDDARARRPLRPDRPACRTASC